MAAEGDFEMAGKICSEAGTKAGGYLSQAAIRVTASRISSAERA